MSPKDKIRFTVSAVSLFLSLLSSPALLAQDQLPALNFHHLTVQDGLANDYVPFFYKDSKGLMWFGTFDGLSKYDGNSIEAYKSTTEAGKGPGDNTITSPCFEDNDGNLWFSSQNGINQYLRTTGEFKYWPLPDSLFPGEADCYAIFLEKDRYLWARGGDEVIKFDIKESVYQKIGKMRLAQRFAYHTDTEDKLLKFAGSLTNMPSAPGFYLGTVDVETGDYQTTHYPLLIKGKATLSFGTCFTSDTLLWVGTTKGLAKVNLVENPNTEPLVYGFYRDQPVGRVWSIQVIDNKYLAVASSLQGLLLFDQERNKFVKSYMPKENEEVSISNGFVGEIHLDQDGVLWAGIYGRGVDFAHMDKVKFRQPLLLDARDEKLKFITGLAEGQDGVLYIGTGDGRVLSYSGTANGTLQNLSWPERVPMVSKEAIQLYTGKDGRIWLANDRSLLLIDDDKRLQLIHRFPDLITSFIQLNSGRIIVSTKVGAFEILKKANEAAYTVRSFNSLTGQGRGVITAAYQDQAGYLFLSVNDRQSLVYLEIQDTFQAQGVLPDISYFRSIVAGEQEGEYWLTTSQGFGKLNREGLRFTTMEKREIGTSYWGLMKDEGYYWLSNKNGIYRYDPGNDQIHDFSIYDGVLKDGVSFNAYLKTSDGRLFWGGPSGLMYLPAEGVEWVETAPKIQITNFLVNSKPFRSDDSTQISELKSFTLGPKQNFLQFEFAGMEYADPGAISYRFKLEPVEKNWVEASANEARYPALPAGTYTFSVEATSADGKQAISDPITVVIQPHFYQTTWFMVAMILLTLGLSWGFYQDQLRRRLRRAQVKNLEELNEYKSRFFTNITHEFRSPLNIILSYLDTALERRVDLKKGNLEMMQRSGRQLLGLVNQILDLRRLEVAKIKVQYEEIDVFKLTSTVVEDFQKLAYGKGIKLICESQVEDTLMASDREKLRKILSNLISNAIKFTTRGGEVKAILQEKPTEMHFQVVDTGIGISKDKLPHIFDRFYQAHDENTNKFGSGVGLALSQELAQAMGGEIRVVSQVGEGSTFTLILPKVDMGSIEDPNNFLESPNEHGNSTEIRTAAINAEEDTKALAAALQQEALEDREGKPLILIVEDNASFRQYIQETLSPHYRTVIRSNGEDGLTTAKKLVPDLVVTDVKMPKMDGYELTSELKSNDATCHIPIILLTGLDDIDARVKGIQKGADIYLNKPFHEQELISWIQNLLRLRGKLQDFYRGFGLSGGNKQEEPVEPKDPDRKFIRKATSFIDENYHKETFSVTELSKMMDMEYVTFYRKFRAITNENAKKSIQDKRIARAKYLLLNEPSKRIRQIAFEVGFSDPGYFSKVFRESEGTTPKKFRN